jgi:hypothetical protein
MAAPNSLLVANRADIARTVTTAGEQCAEEIAALLDSLLFPDGVPPVVTTRELILALVALLVRNQAKLEEKDMLLAKELGDDVMARDARDAQHIHTRAAVIGIRTVIDGMFGPVGLARAGLSAAVPTNNDALVQLATSAAHQIETNDLGTAEGMTLDRPSLAGKLRASAQAFRTTLDMTKTELRETQVARAERDQQAEVWLEIYPGVADILAGLASIAGRTDIADRVRPTARRREGVPEPIDLEPVTDPLVGGPSDPSV